MTPSTMLQKEEAKKANKSSLNFTNCDLSASPVKSMLQMNIKVKTMVAVKKQGKRDSKLK